VCVSELRRNDECVRRRRFVFDRKHRLFFRQSTITNTLVILYFASISKYIHARNKCLAIMT